MAVLGAPVFPHGNLAFFVARAVLAFCPFGTAALKINAAALNGRINLSAVRRLFFFCRRAAEWFGYYW